MARTRFQGLVCDRFKLPGASSKKPGTKMRLNLNYRGQLAKLRTKDGGFYIRKDRGFFEKFWIKTEILLNKGGPRVDIQKRQGLF